MTAIPDHKPELPRELEVEPARDANCRTHGKFESRNIAGCVWSKCPACAVERKEADKRREAEDRKDAEMARWRQRIGMAGIPERFRDRTLMSYCATTEAQRKAHNFAKQYAAEFSQVKQSGRCALFVGKPGTGKTHLAVGIALEVMERHNVTTLFTTTLRAVRRVKESWRRGSNESEAEAIAALVYPDLLILDEVGVQFGSDTEKLILFDVLNERYEQRKPTVLLSNLPAPEVQTYLGERVFDRLREDGGEVVVFDWASHRGANSTEAR